MKHDLGDIDMDGWVARIEGDTTGPCIHLILNTGQVEVTVSMDARDMGEFCHLLATARGKLEDLYMKEVRVEG